MHRLLKLSLLQLNPLFRIFQLRTLVFGLRYRQNRHLFRYVRAANH